MKRYLRIYCFLAVCGTTASFAEVRDLRKAMMIAVRQEFSLSLDECKRNIERWTLKPKCKVAVPLAPGETVATASIQEGRSAKLKSCYVQVNPTGIGYEIIVEALGGPELQDQDVDRCYSEIQQNKSLLAPMRRIIYRPDWLRD